MAFEFASDPSLRSTFDAVADAYDGVRPTLPPDLLDTMVSLGAFPSGGRVLEVGCGPGRETRLLAERGYDVVAVELGERIVEVARRNLAPFPNVRVEQGAFEDWSIPAEPFDALFACFSWHWLDPARGLGQAAAAIRAGGSIAIIGGGHVAGGDTEFFHSVQRCYERHMPGTSPGLRLPEPDDVPPADWELRTSEAFDDPEYRRWVQVDGYTTATYLELLRTFSSHIVLEPANREALFACIGELIEQEYGGRVHRAMLYELCVARRR